MKINLYNHSDWPLWIARIRQLATNLGVWEYCNPDLTKDEVKSAPTNLEFPELPQTQPPTRDDENFESLKEEFLFERMLWDDLNYYKVKQAQNDKIHNALWDVNDAIWASLHPSLKWVLLTDGVYEKLRLLSDLYGPTSSPTAVF